VTIFQKLNRFPVTIKWSKTGLSVNIIIISSSGGGGSSSSEQSVRVLRTPAESIILQLNETRSAIIHRPHSDGSLSVLYQEALVKTRRPENGWNILENGLAAFKDCAGINAVPRCQGLGFCGTGSRC
jgi:hypothetical protein